ncbi:MAG: phosphoribosyl-AMP cyclohydrolase [Candidatus Omnitrophica bacterium 4484_213]|nr:MAG: phosphoribosyl-AMP cyclohydrolase [Candidatus Omnitrophica bacterium 4484_213]
MLKFNKDGLIPVIVQDIKSNRVLMLAYMNAEAFKKTLETRKAHFFSRSRNKLWLKGESSGHYQFVKEIYVDCDEDTLLLKVIQIGGACHKGYHSCFYRRLEDSQWRVVDKKVFEPEEVYSKK